MLKGNASRIGEADYSTSLSERDSRKIPPKNWRFLQGETGISIPAGAKCLAQVIVLHTSPWVYFIMENRKTVGLGSRAAGC